MRKVSTLVVLATLGCVDASEAPSATVRTQANQSSSCATKIMPWGTGDGALGVALPAPERAARGPLAVALRGRDAVVLDNQQARVVLVTAEGAVRELVKSVDHTAEDIAVGPSGDLAVYSPLRGRVEVFASSGDRLGEVAVPRSLRHTTRVELGSSHRVYAYSGFQERHTLGGPSAPMALDSVLRSKVEGAWRIGDDRGVVAVGRDGLAELRVLRASADGGRSVIGGVMPVPGHADAVQIMAAGGSIVCARTETIDRGSAEVLVSRRLLCADVVAGRWLFERDLPVPGLYVPGREIAVSRAQGRLQVLHARPTEAGLELDRCEVTL